MNSSAVAIDKIAMLEEASSNFQKSVQNRRSEAKRVKSETLYEEELTDLFIKQELKGFLTKKEWCLLDLLALDIKSCDIHVFEVKSSRDNVYRVFNQLPYYVWIADYVWLILGCKQKIPKKLPKWLGIIKFNGKSFDRIYVPKNELAINNEFHTVKQIYVANYGLPADGKFDPMQYSSSWRFLTGLIKKWFINSIFRDSVPLPKNEKIIPYTKIEKGLLYFLKKVDTIEDLVYEERNGKFYPTRINITKKQLEKAFARTTLDSFAVKENEPSPE